MQNFVNYYKSTQFYIITWHTETFLANSSAMVHQKKCWHVCACDWSIEIFIQKRYRNLLSMANFHGSISCSLFSNFTSSVCQKQLKATDWHPHSRENNIINIYLIYLSLYFILPLCFTNHSYCIQEWIQRHILGGGTAKFYWIFDA